MVCILSSWCWFWFPLFVFYVLKIGEILTRNDFNAGISMVKLRQQKSTARVCLWHKKRVSFIGQESGVS